MSPISVSYNAHAEHINKDLMSMAMKFEILSGKNGVSLNDVTYNTLIHGFCKEGQLNEANKIFREMKAAVIAPNVETYNTPINGITKRVK